MPGLRGGGGRRDWLLDRPVDGQEAPAVPGQDRAQLVVVGLHDPDAGLGLRIARRDPDRRVLRRGQRPLARLANHAELAARPRAVGMDPHEEDRRPPERERRVVLRVEVAGGGAAGARHALGLVAADPGAGRILVVAEADIKLDVAVILSEAGRQVEIHLIRGGRIVLAPAAGAAHGEGQGEAEDEGTTFVLILAVRAH